MNNIARVAKRSNPIDDIEQWMKRQLHMYHKIREELLEELSKSGGPVSPVLWLENKEGYDRLEQWNSIFSSAGLYCWEEVGSSDLLIKKYSPENDPRTIVIEERSLVHDPISRAYITCCSCLPSPAKPMSFVYQL